MKPIEDQYNISQSGLRPFPEGSYCPNTLAQSLFFFHALTHFFLFLSPPPPLFDPDFAFTRAYFSDEEARIGRVSCKGGTMLQLSAAGTAGVAEFERAFFATPGVDRQIVHQRWLPNHYRCV